ncbi:unnamed protein product [Sphagnum balticum]
MRKKKSELLVEGLLGKIAYSPKILEDQLVNERINRLMDNKIFQKSVSKMFPESLSKLKSLEEQAYPYHDELESATVLAPSDGSESEQISVIDINHDDVSMLSQPSYVLEALGRKEEDEYADDNDLGYDQYDFGEDQLMNGCAKLT